MKHNFSPLQIIEILAPFLTEPRKSKIDKVVSQRTHNFVTVMENIYDRGNISAAMRSSEAFGFHRFSILDTKNEKFKVANRVAAGTDKWLEIKHYDDQASLAKDLKAQGFQIFCTHLEASRPIDEIDFTKPTALVFGNEKDGVSPEMVKLSDGNIIIPMHGMVQSFNISVAAALSFQHVFYDRTKKLGKSGDLTNEQRAQMIAEYYLKTLDSGEQILEETWQKQNLK